jgi:hypothetical protein
MPMMHGGGDAGMRMTRVSIRIDERRPERERTISSADQHRDDKTHSTSPPAAVSLDLFSFRPNNDVILSRRTERSMAGKRDKTRYR